MRSLPARRPSFRVRAIRSIVHAHVARNHPSFEILRSGFPGKAAGRYLEGVSPEGEIPGRCSRTGPLAPLEGTDSRLQSGGTDRHAYRPADPERDPPAA